MKYLLAFILFIINFQSNGQIEFIPLEPLSPTPTNMNDFIGVRDGSYAYADVDGDNDLDVFICGLTDPSMSSSNVVSKLYLNDGNGNLFEDLTNIFSTSNKKNVAFSDVDNDGDQDVLFGTTLYLNDGSGLFSEDASNNFSGSSSGFIMFCDVDGDLVDDLLISGLWLGQPSTKLYINDGSGSFTENLNAGFDGVSDGSSDFSDVDGDNDFDLIITGKNSLDIPISKLYMNDGNGLFVENVSDLIEGVYASSVNFIDVDGDNDEDFFISGNKSASERISKIFINDGSGVFDEQLIQSIQGFGETSSSFGDIDNDNDADLIICGNIGYSGGSYVTSTKLYTNDGNGNFSEETITPFEGVNEGFAFMLDLDSDSHLDIIIAGVTDYYFPKLFTKIYANSGDGNFLESYKGVIPDVNQSFISSADVNNDNTEDLFLIGYDGSKLISKLFLNNGIGNYTELLNTPFPELRNGSTAFLDVDNDGDQDVIVSGSTFGNQAFTELYLNDGTGVFILETNSFFYERRFTSIDFSDIDNDGDLDILISGSSNSGTTSSYLYENDAGIFSYVSGSNLAGASSGVSLFADIDNDGDEDIFISGNANDFSSSKVAKFYLNDGLGNFTYSTTNTGVVGVGYSDASFDDVDNDGDLDLLLAGETSSLTNLTRLYLNDGNGNFSNVNGIELINIKKGSVEFSDIDSDGDKDIFLSGAINGVGNVSAMYINDGSGSFIQHQSDLFEAVSSGSSLFTDIDNDGDEDAVIIGQTDNSGLLFNSEIYLNTTCPIGYSYSTETACGSYEWIDGVTYYSSDTIFYTYSGGAVSGCDSIVTLDLIILSEIAIDTQIACDNFTWLDGNTYSSNNTTAFHTIPGAGVAGCDSLIQLNLTINSQYITIDTLICSGQSYTFPDGVTQTNITADFDYVSNFVSVVSGCDSIITTSLHLLNNTITLNGVTVTAAETNLNNYSWLNCDDNYNVLFPSSTPIFEFQIPGVYALESTNGSCIDTSNCITITNQDFYNLPSYSPLSAEVFAFPVTSLDTCDGLALGFGNGGFPPYYFDWQTQTNNDFSYDLDSLCEGFHTLKIVDMIGDSALVDYFVTDSANWFDWYQDNATYVDTLYLQAEDCVIDMNLPIDSTYISSFYYLYSGTGTNEEYYYMEISYYQTGIQYTHVDTVLMELNGVYLIDFSITCPTRSTSRIKTILMTVDYPNVLGIVNNDKSLFKMYPNPAVNTVEIDLGKTNSNSNVFITDFSGKIVYDDFNVNKQNIIVDLKNYSSGLYFVTIISSKGKNVMKLIKQ